MRIIFLLVLIVFGTVAVHGNPKTTKPKAPVAPKTTVPVTTKTTGPETKAKAGTQAKTTTTTKPTTTVAITSEKAPVTPTTPKAPSAATLAITSHVTTDFINQLPKGAKLPASTPVLPFKLMLNGKQTTVLAKQDLKAVLTALFALASSAPTNAQVGILIALNYGRLFLNPTGTPGSATTIEAAVAAFQIAQYIGVKQ